MLEVIFVAELKRNGLVSLRTFWTCVANDIVVILVIHSFELAFSDIYLLRRPRDV